MHVSNAGFNKSLCSLSVFSFSNSVTSCRQTYYLENEGFSYLVQVDEHASRICVDIQSFLEILSMVNLFDKFYDDLGNAVNFRLLTHEIDLVVQSFSDLENRVNQETITQHILLRAVKTKHFFAKLFFHSRREIVEKTEQIFESDQL